MCIKGQQKYTYLSTTSQNEINKKVQEGSERKKTRMGTMQKIHDKVLAGVPQLLDDFHKLIDDQTTCK